MWPCVCVCLTRVLAVCTVLCGCERAGSVSVCILRVRACVGFYGFRSVQVCMLYISVYTRCEGGGASERGQPRGFRTGSFFTTTQTLYSIDPDLEPQWGSRESRWVEHCCLWDQSLLNSSLVSHISEPQPLTPSLVFVKRGPFPALLLSPVCVSPPSLSSMRKI